MGETRWRRRDLRRIHGGWFVKQKLRFGVAGVLLATLLAACGTTARNTPTAPASSITVAIEVKVVGPPPSDVRYSLGCNPTSGTLPFAARVCEDIATHPSAMLRPRFSSTLCYSSALGPIVTVRTTWQGGPSTFSGEPGCGWPGATPLSVYYNASQHDRDGLDVSSHP